MPILSNILKRSIPSGEFELSQNQPNPFTKTTTIKYSVPRKSKVMIMINNINGQIIDKLILKDQQAGEYELEFYADGLRSGTYFYHVITGDFYEYREMELNKIKKPADRVTNKEGRNC
ncbi:MAG: T9SS type A sorting domain-containing protein [Ignavibacteriaceae bacterium]|nr:T9SS type A sorting domain-containing protein [Ignavibacteriaceae bacterium]